MSTNGHNTLGNELDNALTVVKGKADDLVDQGQEFVDRIVPPQQRSAMWERFETFVDARPKLAAFLLCQIALSGIPLLAFATFAGTVLFFSLFVGIATGVIAALAFTGFMVGIAALFALPTLFATSTAATTTFIWGLVSFYVIRWFNSGQAKAQAKAVGDKINSAGSRAGSLIDSAGNRAGSLMDSARESARETARDYTPSKRTNGYKSAPAKPQQISHGGKQSGGDEKLPQGGAVRSEPVRHNFDDLKVNSTANFGPSGPVYSTDPKIVATSFKPESGVGGF